MSGITEECLQVQHLAEDTLIAAIYVEKLHAHCKLHVSTISIYLK